MTDPDIRMTRSCLVRTILLALAYVAIAVALIGANPFRGETTGPFDLLASYPGWNPDGEAVHVRNGERSDILDALVPAWMEARRQLRAGEPPIWNPLQAGGNAAVLDPTSAELTVGFALFASTPDPALGFYLAVLSSLVIAGLGMHLLIARDHSHWAALFAGISYMACGFITAWLFWPHTYTAIWIPWLLLAISQFATTRSPRAFAGISAASAMMFLGGFPFVVAMGFGAALVHAFFVVISLPDRKLRFRRMLEAVGGILLGLALAAVPLLSLWAGLDALDLSYRSGGSGLKLATHARLLLMPWAGGAPHVETNMYVGMAALLFAALGLAGMFRRKANAMLLTGIALIFVGTMLTFGLLPREIGKHLPVLSNNPWSRAILLLDIGLIVVAASGVDLVARRVRRGPVLAVAGIVLCLVHGVDLGRQFRKFNGATPARYFYPVGPELAWAQKNIGPFQYVAQDSSYFLISGSLGAIGLREWFAHSLRSPQFRNLLDALADKPFTSPTATAIGLKDFHWSGDLADTVALCYAVYPASVSTAPVVVQAQGQTSVALGPINNILVSQSIELPINADLSGLAIRMANYRGSGLDGFVTVSLHAADREIASAGMAALDIQDNQMATFRFPGLTRVEAGSYELQLLYKPGPKNKNLTAWVLQDAPGQVRRGQETVPGSLAYAIMGVEDGTLDVVANEGGSGVAVAKNSGCASGAYWTADLTNPRPSIAPGRTRLLKYRPHRFTIESLTPAAGFVVVPMRYQAGWEAWVDGRRAQLRLVNGVLPAVAVAAGKSSLTFAYRPPYWRVGLSISVLALLLLAWLNGVFGRRKKMHSRP